MATKNLCVVAAALILVSPYTEARQDYPRATPAVAPLFAIHEPLQVTIQAPLTTLMKERPEEEYLEGTFSFTGDDGLARTVNLKIRARGKYRRMPEHCDLPPVKLNFRTSQLANTVFAGQDKLKMVTHCRNNRPSYVQLVLREFLAYRILNVITNKSYGVRLLRINYVDTEGGESMTNFGFVIETADDVAERNRMKSVKLGDIIYDDLEHRQENLVNVFEYLIGNTEYSLVKSEPDDDCCHNSDLMSATGGPPFTPLPYDFDFAGIVNAPYAQPNPRYHLRNVRQRLYKGQCGNNELLPGTLQRYVDKKEAI
ncbi:MAG: hypothetical protein ACR2QI_10505, partial [Woeseiaceae bacterium]